MIVLFIGMLVCVGLAVAVILFVASPSFRDGERVLTPDGEKRVAKLRTKASNAAQRAEALTSRGADAAKSKLHRDKTEGEGADDPVEDTASTPADSAEKAKKDPVVVTSKDTRPQIEDDATQAIDVRDVRAQAGETPAAQESPATRESPATQKSPFAPEAEFTQKSPAPESRTAEKASADVAGETETAMPGTAAGLASPNPSVPGIASPAAAGIASAAATRLETQSDLRVEREPALDPPAPRLSLAKDPEPAEPAAPTPAAGTSEPAVDTTPVMEPDATPSEAPTEEQGATPSFLERIGRPLERMGADTDRVGPRHAR